MWHPRSHGRRTNWTAPRDGKLAHNFHPDAALQWGRKPSPSPQDSGPPHQFFQQWRPPRMGIPCLSPAKEPSLSSLAGALLLLDSWRSPRSPERPSLASPTSNAGHAESVCCPGSAARSRGDHEAAQIRPCDKFCKKNDWVLSQHLWAQSQKIAQHHSSTKLSSFCTFSSNVTVAGAHQYRSHHHLCQWWRPTEEEHEKASVVFAPVGPKHHLTLWTATVCPNMAKERNIVSLSRKLWWTTNNTMERKHYVLVENIILTRHNGVKNWHPLLSTDRTT